MTQNKPGFMISRQIKNYKISFYEAEKWFNKEILIYVLNLLTNYFGQILPTIPIFSQTPSSLQHYVLFLLKKNKERNTHTTKRKNHKVHFVLATCFWTCSVPFHCSEKNLIFSSFKSFKLQIANWWEVWGGICTHFPFSVL